MDYIGYVIGIIGLGLAIYFRYLQKKEQNKSENDINKMVYEASPEDFNYNDETGEYIFKNDIKLKNVTDKDAELEDTFHEPWVEKFLDIRAYAQKMHIYYENTRIKTVYCAHVDGFRYLMPYPKTRDELVISVWQYRFGKIINTNYDFDSALRRAGITVERQQ